VQYLQRSVDAETAAHHRQLHYAARIGAPIKPAQVFATDYEEPEAHLKIVDHENIRRNDGKIVLLLRNEASELKLLNKGVDLSHKKTRRA